MFTKIISTMSKTFVQYGCGLSAPEEWINFDASPSLRLQKIPLIGGFFKYIVTTPFPKNVKYGNIIKGLPVPENSCDGLYCSHVLEHLSLEDFRTSLKNSYKILRPGGVFRCLVPDLEYAAKKYVEQISQGKRQASLDFMGDDTLLGMNERPTGIKGLLRANFGNSKHLWMWDKYSLKEELETAGFKSIRNCSYHDAEDPQFKMVEEEGRFRNAVALEASK